MTERKIKYTYFVGERRRPFEVDLDCNSDSDPEYVAECCAEDYLYNHDGLEASWPIEFLVVTTEGKRHRVSVELESRPHFCGTVLEETPKP